MIFDGEKKVYILSEQEYDEMFNGEAHINLELIKVRKCLEIATKALKEIRKRIEDFNDDPMNKIGFMVYGTLHECLKESKKALKEMEGIK